MGRGKEKQVFLEEHNFCQPPSHRSVGPQKSAQLLLPTVPLPTGYCCWSAENTAVAPCAHRENEHVFPEEGKAYGLRAWLASNARALCCRAVEKSAGEIPDCSPSKEKLSIGVFGGL